MFDLYIDTKSRYPNNMFYVVNILLVISLIVVAAVMVTGLVSMAKGGDFNKKYGNKLMQARVASQTIALLLLALSYYLSKT